LFRNVRDRRSYVKRPEVRNIGGMGGTFRRARSEEQRQIRRHAILDTTAAMLEAMPVGEVSLNQLSRRVGLAKSNVLRYFESREAILLELLDRATRQWLTELAEQLPTKIDPNGTARERGDQLVAALAHSLMPHRVLCDLLSVQAGVLEHNVSADVAARHKRASIDNLTALAKLVRRHLPELGDDEWKVCGMAVVFVGALWTHARPSASVLEAYDADPALAAMRMDFPTALEDTLATLIAGTMAGPPAP
jgi:AcrR family transcriptional regulator